MRLQQSQQLNFGLAFIGAKCSTICGTSERCLVRVTGHTKPLEANRDPILESRSEYRYLFFWLRHFDYATLVTPRGLRHKIGYATYAQYVFKNILHSMFGICSCSGDNSPGSPPLP